MKYFTSNPVALFDDVITQPPNSAIEISDEVYLDLISGQEAGKTIAADQNGAPVLTDPPLPTQKELIAQAEATKSALRASTDSEIAWRQDAVDAGIATEEEATSLIEWKKYRIQLMRVDTAKPVWPDKPA
ncbi:TPA: tail fiber assembly protein [Escherichia coli]|nr:tail fiber assembly protein [Escherichia coli]